MVADGKNKSPDAPKKKSSQSLLITESNKMHTELVTETQDGE